MRSLVSVFRKVIRSPLWLSLILVVLASAYVGAAEHMPSAPGVASVSNRITVGV